MDFLEKQSKLIQSVVAIVTALVTIVGILLGIQGKLAQIISITTVSLLLAIGLFLIAKSKLEKSVLLGPNSKPIPQTKPKWLTRSLILIGVTWLIIVLSIVLSKEPFTQPDILNGGSLTPILPPFTPIITTKTTPIVITPHDGDIDSELLVAWENTQFTLNTNNNAVEVLERNDTKIKLLARASDEGNSGTDWRISSKRLALELLAAYTISLFENQETAKYYFVRGSIEQVYFDDNSKTITIRFAIQLKEE